VKKPAVAEDRPASARAAGPRGAWWSVAEAELFGALGSTPAGLSRAEARRRLASGGPNELVTARELTRLGVLWGQLRNPLMLLLLFAAAASMATGQWVDAFIVLAIVAISVGIGYSREYRAGRAVARLRARVQSRARVLRDGAIVQLPAREIVPGDVVLLAAGSLVPADARVLEATDLFVNQAVLTGESLPVEKGATPAPVTATLIERDNCVWLGTNVRSGTARCLVVATGRDSAYGGIAQRLALRPPETEFERGTRRFGYLLTSAMLVIVLCVFVVNMLFGRPPAETFLFSVALAVGLSPELLPAILTVNLARGAQMMAARGVLVRRLNAIENLGSVDILCTDKTGTLTEGVVRLDGAYDANGAASAEVQRLAQYNAALQTGLGSALDEAIQQSGPAPDLPAKLAEIPYDFVRKRLSVVVAEGDGALLVTKGAFRQVFAGCSCGADGAPLDAAARAAIEARFEAWSRDGVRVLALATRTLPRQASYCAADEDALSFRGFLAFVDRPKEGVARAVRELGALGVGVKLITGDARLVALHVARAVGLGSERVLSGEDLDRLHDDALWRAAEQTDLFVEVDPNQKERIILALKRTGHVVGFLGDGVNDAPAMHAADASLSVDTAVDVAREAADFVLLQRDLDVIRAGIQEGRHTFANTLKYVLTTTSANLGNMISMAVASLVLPFLPLLAGQILLNNFLSDIPALGLASDRVDAELVQAPRRWSMRFIGRFMVEFGLLSSLFDFLTFGLLWWLTTRSAELFRTGWFIESLLSELVVALIVRTRRPCYRSRPGTALLWSTLAVAVLTLALPYLPGAAWLGLVPLPATLLLAICTIALLYAVAAELTKSHFYRAADR
jgi:Mg2+-importing ATPase